MKNIVFIIVIAAAISACSTNKALNQPDKKDLSVLAVGSERKLVVAELGPPIHQETINGKQVDTYSFIQGYSGVTKGLRAAGHTFMSIGTLGVWEIAGTGIEGALSGDKVIVEVTYSKNMIESVRALKGKEVVPNEYMQ